MTMKQSRFNLIIKTKDPSVYILYNTLNSVMLKIDDEALGLLKDPKRELVSAEEKETVSMLTKKGFLLEENVDENKRFAVRMGECKYGSDSCEIMINVTYACNLACPYCFEGKRKIKDLKDEDYKRIIKFIKNMVHLHRSRSLELHLFGGEPLVRPDRTFQIIDEIKRWSASKNVGFKFIIYTNGTLSDDKIIENLIKNRKHIRYIHFTLDGPKEIHDKRRFYKAGQGSYEQIIKTLKRFRGKDIYSVIRINIDRKNHDSIPKLLEDLKKEGLEDIPIGFSFIRDMTHSCGGYSDSVSDSDPGRWLPAIWKKALDLNFNFVIKPDPSYIYCGAFKNSSFIVDLDGSVYKCAGLQGIPEHKIGKINENGLLDEIGYPYYEFMSRDPLSMKPCKNCPVLPLCGGGCASCSYTRHHDYHVSDCFDRNVALIKERIRLYLLHKGGEQFQGIL